jgi:hypothetical protein
MEAQGARSDAIGAGQSLQRRRQDEERSYQIGKNSKKKKKKKKKQEMLGSILQADNEHGDDGEHDHET